MEIMIEVAHRSLNKESNSTMSSATRATHGTGATKRGPWKPEEVFHQRGGELEGRMNLGDFGIDAKMILKWVLEKYDR